MHYDYNKTTFQNILDLFSGLTKTKVDVSVNKTAAETEMLKIQADVVEAVIDEYNALIDGETKE